MPSATQGAQLQHNPVFLELTFEWVKLRINKLTNEFKINLPEISIDFYKSRKELAKVC